MPSLNRAVAVYLLPIGYCMDRPAVLRRREARAEVAGMDSSDLRSDTDFRRAVEGISGQAAHQGRGETECGEHR
jgi:hypothetical protein